MVQPGTNSQYLWSQ